MVAQLVERVGHSQVAGGMKSKKEDKIMKTERKCDAWERREMRGEEMRG